jgi:hypothetical protein
VYTVPGINTQYVLMHTQTHTYTCMYYHGTYLRMYRHLYLYLMNVSSSNSIIYEQLFSLPPQNVPSVLIPQKDPRNRFNRRTRTHRRNHRRRRCC